MRIKPPTSSEASEVDGSMPLNSIKFLQSAPGNSLKFPSVTPAIPSKYFDKDNLRLHLRWGFKEEGRGTRNGYEASKGSKGISGL